MAADDARREQITKRSVDRAKPAAGRYTVWDTELKGFGLRVTPSGTKTFIIRYRARGGRRGTLRQTVIGRYGPRTPEVARKAARKALGAVVNGADPQAEITKKRAEMTVAELCDLYMLEGTGMKKDSTLYIDRTRISTPISDSGRTALAMIVREVCEGEGDWDEREPSICAEGD